MHLHQHLHQRLPARFSEAEQLGAAPARPSTLRALLYPTPPHFAWCYRPRTICLHLTGPLESPSPSRRNVPLFGRRRAPAHLLCQLVLGAPHKPLVVHRPPQDAPRAHHRNPRLMPAPHPARRLPGARRHRCCRRRNCTASRIPVAAICGDHRKSQLPTPKGSLPLASFLRMLPPVLSRAATSSHLKHFGLVMPAPKQALLRIHSLLPACGHAGLVFSHWLAFPRLWTPACSLYMPHWMPHIALSPSPSLSSFLLDLVQERVRLSLATPSPVVTDARPSDPPFFPPSSHMLFPNHCVLFIGPHEIQSSSFVNPCFPSSDDAKQHL